MNGWVKADIHYGLPMARLYVTAESMTFDPVANGISGEVGRLADNPAGMDRYVGELIRAYRPELVGGSLLAVRFDFERACWEFLYVHPSLPRKATGDVTERMPLVPGKDGDRPRVVGCPPEHREAAERLLAAVVLNNGDY
jgi:hypothetical protein